MVVLIDCTGPDAAEDASGEPATVMVVAVAWTKMVSVVAVGCTVFTLPLTVVTNAGDVKVWVIVAPMVVVR